MAGHEEEGEEFLILRGRVEGEGRGVNTLVLATEVVKNSEGGRLVDEGEEARKDDIDTEADNEVRLVTNGWTT